MNVHRGMEAFRDESCDAAAPRPFSRPAWTLAADRQINPVSGEQGVPFCRIAP
ncbi:hypothetical protein [Lichenibacterium minor]|uniref:hypothetical protein n=1 Tax=Lichenibacterium minor TaxID=2316528 RepID=UPI001A9379D6|nr:hypothetical protein [Lichenibacterium minor]